MPTSLHLSSFVAKSRELFGKNLKAIILFGSGANVDFVQSISDLDLLFVFDFINLETISQLETTEFQYTDYFRSRVDIKPLTVSEITGPIKGNTRNPFFNHWNLKMIEDGKHVVLYKDECLTFPNQIPFEEVRKDALDIASKCILKFRKLMFFKRTMILDGELRALSDTDMMKVCVSCFKHIVTFCVIANGVDCPDLTATLREGERLFGDMSLLKQALDMRKKSIFDLEVIKQGYEFAEHIYAQTIS